MTDEVRQDIYERAKKNSMFRSLYMHPKYAGEKRMLQILKSLNKAINSCWEFANVYEGSELDNQHGEVNIDEIDDIAIKLEEIRASLFGDSLNYDRIVELCESQMEEVDKLEREFYKENEQ